MTYTFWKEGYAVPGRHARRGRQGADDHAPGDPPITGKVTDAATGRPIEKVTAIPVADNPYGRPAGRTAAQEGVPRRHLHDRGRPEPDRRRLPRADRGRGLPNGHERCRARGAFRPTFDFRLEPAPPVRGRVVDAQGQPVAGARVYLATASQILGIENQDEDGWPSNQKVATDGQGTFSFPAQFERYAVIVRHNTAGYAEVTSNPTSSPASWR